MPNLARPSVGQLSARRPPHYREEFYTAVSARTALEVRFRPSARPRDGFSDASDGPSGSELRTLRLGSVSLGLPPAPTWLWQHDVVVVQDTFRHPSTVAALLFCCAPRALRMPGPGVVVLGFGYRPTGSSLVQRLLIRLRDYLVDCYATYTPRGVAELARLGIDTPAISIDNCGNTRAARQALGLAAQTPRAEPHQLRMLYMGRLSAEKGTSELPVIARELREIAELRVVGGGPLAAEIHAAHNEGVLDWRGASIDPLSLADALTWADVVVAPGRVGLTAVDAMVAGRPVVTYGPRHRAQSPEVEYLVSDVNSVVVDSPDIRAFISSVRILAHDPIKLARLAASAEKTGARFSSERMADAFLEAVSIAHGRGGAR